MLLKYRFIALVISMTTLLSGCSILQSQRADIEPPMPSWATIGEKWDLTGLTISTYASVPYNFNNYSQAVDPGLSGEIHNELDLAEEAAYRRARLLVLEELTQVWLDYLNASAQPEPKIETVREQIEKNLRGIFVNKRFYDNQRRIFHIQVYLPGTRIIAILENSFKQQIHLENNGQIKADKVG